MNRIELTKRQTKINYLLRVRAINAIYEEHAKIGLSNEAIFQQHIYPRFLISKVTFYRFLKIDADEELKALGYEG